MAGRPLVRYPDVRVSDRVRARNPLNQDPTLGILWGNLS